MKSFLIVGMGRFGETLATELTRLEHEVLVIDSDEDKIQRISNIVTHAVIGDATDESVLRSIGVRNFDHVIVATSEDLETSVLVTIMLKELGAANVICKAKSEIHKRVLERVGADRVVIPERDMGRRLARSIAYANISDYIEIATDCSIIERVAPAEWIGKTLRELDIRARYGVTIIGIQDKAKTRFKASPEADYRIQPGDLMIIVGDKETLMPLISGGLR